MTAHNKKKIQNAADYRALTYKDENSRKTMQFNQDSMVKYNIEDLKPKLAA